DRSRPASSCLAWCRRAASAADRGGGGLWRSWQLRTGGGWIHPDLCRADLVISGRQLVGLRQPRGPPALVAAAAGRHADAAGVVDSSDALDRASWAMDGGLDRGDAADRSAVPSPRSDAPLVDEAAGAFVAGPRDAGCPNRLVGPL
ncbi:MAG: hypothetical protein AVDCRST_MAG62-720, partial [uncultured Sphingomonas sp.]